VKSSPFLYAFEQQESKENVNETAHENEFIFMLTFGYSSTVDVAFLYKQVVNNIYKINIKMKFKFVCWHSSSFEQLIEGFKTENKLRISEENYIKLWTALLNFYKSSAIYTSLNIRDVKYVYISVFIRDLAVNFQQCFDHPLVLM
jgi:adenylate kinase family enzyme